MSTYPTTPRADFLQWCEAHAPVFAKQNVDIGLSPEQAGEFESLAKKAAEALLAQTVAQQAAAVATQRVRQAFAALDEGAADAVRNIRAFAQTSAAPESVYNRAEIASPARRSPLPPPARPRQLAITLEAATGALTISWKARQPRGSGGATYFVRRRLPGAAEFAFIGATGIKTFVDTTVPAGAERVEYTVQAQRGNRSGPVSEVLWVALGRVDGKSRNVETSKSQKIDVVNGRRASRNGRVGERVVMA